MANGRGLKEGLKSGMHSSQMLKRCNFSVLTHLNSIEVVCQKVLCCLWPLKNLQQELLTPIVMVAGITCTCLSMTPDLCGWQEDNKALQLLWTLLVTNAAFKTELQEWKVFGNYSPTSDLLSPPCGLKEWCWFALRPWKQMLCLCGQRGCKRQT